MARRSAAQTAASKRNLEKARKARKRGGVGQVPKRYSGGKGLNVRKAAAAQRRGNYLFSKGSRSAAHKEYVKAETLLGRRVAR